LTLGWNGQLSVPRGGTGLSTLTAGLLPYGAGTSALASSTRLTFDGLALNSHSLNVTDGNATFAAGAHPTLNYHSNLGSLSRKYLSIHGAEMFVETLVAQDTQATIGGRILVAPTTLLTQDLSPSATTITVKHNNLASGDIVRLEAGGRLEWIAITSGPSAGISETFYHPLIGLTSHGVDTDFEYGGGSARGISGPARNWAAELERRVKRQFLHAAQLRFAHPRTGEALHFEAALPADLAAAAEWAEATSHSR
jgi:hypothetical protein